MKSAEELRIEPEVHAQLRAVRDFFLTVAPKAMEPGADWINNGGIGLVQPAIFNMNITVAAYTCGTALCIGGYCELLKLRGKLTSTVLLTQEEASQIGNFVDFHRDTVLRPLFFPNCIHNEDWEKLTAKMAAKAIQNFLLTGDPKWHQIARAAGLRATESTGERYDGGDDDDDDDYEVGSGNFIDD